MQSKSKYYRLGILMSGIVLGYALTSCNSGGTGSSLSLLGELKEFFVTPVQDSIIAVKDSTDVPKSTSFAVSPQSISHKDTISNNGAFRFDLTQADLRNCSTYGDIQLDDKIPEGEIFNLGNAFAWSSDNSIDLYLPGEFSYLSTFFQYCKAKEFMDERDIDPSLDDLRKKAESYEYPDNTSDPNLTTKVTLDFDNILNAQELKLSRSMIPSLTDSPAQFIIPGENGGTVNVPADILYFFRVYQIASVSSQDKESTFHQMAFTPTAKYNRENDTDKAKTLPAWDEYEGGSLLLRQKLTLVISDASNDAQFVGFVSVYPYSDKCMPKADSDESGDPTGAFDYSAYESDHDNASVLDESHDAATTAEGFQQLKCLSGYPDASSDIQNLATGPYLKDLSTDIMVYTVAIKKGVGSLAERVICEDVSSRGFATKNDILGCFDGGNGIERIESYNADGEKITSHGVEEHEALNSGREVLLEQLRSYVKADQLAGTVAQAGDLMESVCCRR